MGRFKLPVESRTQRFRRLHPEYDKKYYLKFIKRHPNFIADQNVKRAAYRTTWSKQRVWNQKFDVLRAYGNKCVCCDEFNPEFLTIDHKFGNGKEDRKRHGSGFYRHLKKAGYPKEDYQLLCMNCNFAKGKYQVCPHKRS